MRPMRSTDLELALILPETPMFSDVIAKLQADLTLSDTRRRDLISGLSTVAKALGRPPEDIPCDTRWLQKRLGKISPAALNLTIKTWQNARSNARTAMAQIGLVERKIRNIDDLTPDWRHLWELVLESKDRTLQPSLCRFVHFLSREGVRPEDVEAEHADLFHQAIVANEISKSPETPFRAAVNGWNLARARIDAWPKQRLPLPSRQVKFILDLDSFPEGFQHSYEALFRHFSEPDLFSEQARSVAVRPSTLNQYRSQFLRFASELVQSGVAIDQLTDVRTIVDPTMAERGLRHMLARNGNATKRAIVEAAALLRNLGRVLEIPEEQQAALKHLASRTAGKKQNCMTPKRGMTPKNRARLLVLQDERQQQRLLNLPDVLFRKAAQLPQAFSRGLQQEDAIAMAIFLVCPVRIKNLASIHLERNLQRPGDGRAYLVFEEDETKTGQPIQFEVPKDVLRMIDRHLKSRDPWLCPPGTPWLFPCRDGVKSIDPNQLSQRLTRRIRRETGLEMNAHLFRHFAVMLWLDANPGAYEAARHFLGHSAVSHTINMYCGLENNAAIKAFSDLVTTKQGRKR